MDSVIKKFENALRILRECEGVVATKILSEDEKKKVLQAEGEVEERIVFGMCKSKNEAMREALQREFSLAMVIDTSKFQFPHHSQMIIKSGDQIVGEHINVEKSKELKKDPTNVFLWDNFVVYMRKLPRGTEERKKLRLVYLPREPIQLGGISYVKGGVFGTPCTESDVLIKQMLDCQSDEPVIGTCLVGFNVE